MTEEKKYVALDGMIYSEDQPLLLSCNRGFRYGDALFETMHANGVTVQLLEAHYNRLKASMEKLKMNVPASFTLSYLAGEIARLVKKNKLFLGNRVRLTVFRVDGGYYTPVSNDVHFLIEASPLPSAKYELNKKGLIIDIYEGHKKHRDDLANLKTANALIYVMAGIYKTENNLDDCLLLNDSGAIAEAINSNIFVLKKDRLLTPSLNEGCVAGIMRAEILRLASSAGCKVQDNISLRPSDLLEADEIFLTNAISGIRWVVAYRQRRFFNTLSGKLIKMLKV